ncbi:MAG TPA: helix-turn-helix domain-containing protein [Rubrobacteraceae bacterium]|nr:helix-turn-helix domain-containing protein [Rubrobacteraceae bacterium]
MDEARITDFGASLRRLREASGLTQEELASRAGLSSKGIGALERGERKRPHPHTVNALVDALDLAGPERDAFFGAVPRRIGMAFVPVADLEEAIPALPAPLTLLIGRERDVAVVDSLLEGDGARLLTLTGTGGVGKTRLALEVAGQARERFPDGVAFVPLAPVADPALLVPTVVQILGLREAGGETMRELVQRHLRGKRLLLVLDNFEHLLEAAPEISVLLSTVPSLKILATSRAPLRVRGEHEYPVAPLAVPYPTRVTDTDVVAAAPSAQLFAERAREAAPSFSLTRKNAAAVAAICWRLDGLPLALELAAARVRFLGPTELLSRLDQVLQAEGARDLPERQRTMRATLDWSYGLLSEEEKPLFGHLSVFAGGFTLEAAEAVGAQVDETGTREVLGLLEGLVAQSLVMAEASPEGGEADETRYGMLEPVRQYARAKLEEVGEGEEERRRHAMFFLDLVERAAPELRGPWQVEWLHRLDAEHGNLRAAMAWALSAGEIETGARLAWALFVFWWMRGYYAEGRRASERVLAADAELTASLRGKMLFVAGMMCNAQGDHERGQTLDEEGVRLLREAGDRPTLAIVLAALGYASVRRRDYDRATVLLEESLELYRELEDRWGTAKLLNNLGRLRTLRGDSGDAKPLLEEGLALSKELGDTSAIAEALHNLAVAALLPNEHDRAAVLFEESLTLAAEVGHRSIVADCLEGLACAEAGRREPQRSARLWASAEALRETAGASSEGTERPLYEAYLISARAALDETMFEAAWASGRAMTLQQAVAYALEERELAPEPPTAD